MSTLQLRTLTPELHKHAQERFEQRDLIGLLILIEGHVRVSFVRDNIQVLKDVELYEAALLQSLLGSSQTNAYYHPELLMMLLVDADRERMLSLGDPLPESPDSHYTIYRGIAGDPEQYSRNGSRLLKPGRRPNGISWTTSSIVATHFATFYDDRTDPVVLSGKIPKDLVYCYTNQRSEHEVMCIPAFDYVQVPFAPKEELEAWREQIKAKDKTALENLKRRLAGNS